MAGWRSLGGDCTVRAFRDLGVVAGDGTSDDDIWVMVGLGRRCDEDERRPGDPVIYRANNIASQDGSIAIGSRAPLGRLPVAYHGTSRRFDQRAATEPGHLRARKN